MDRSGCLRESIRWAIPLVFVLCTIARSPAAAQEVDVYFITGQSNGNNFAKEASTSGSTNVGFTLHFARVADTFNDFPNHTGIATSFASSNLDASLATSILASGLQQGGRDIAIFTFARNGAGLNNNMTSEGNDWIWYPGADPANGQLFNDSLYTNAINWNEARLTTLHNAGLIPVVKGLFWFQGEKDGRLQDDDVYQRTLTTSLLVSGKIMAVTYRLLPHKFVKFKIRTPTSTKLSKKQPTTTRSWHT